MTHHLFVIRNSYGYVSGVPGFHLEHVPGPFDPHGGHCHTVLRRQTPVGRSEARFRLTAVIVKRIGHARRFQLTESLLVHATYERHVVVTDAKRCAKQLIDKSKL